MHEPNVFENIIDKMVQDGYLEEYEAVSLKDKYSSYLENIKYVNNQRSKNKARPANTQTTTSPKSESKSEQIIAPISQQISINNLSNQPVSEPPIQLTKEQIKERNLSWILNIGVILILISGLIFATTTWNAFFDIDKVLLLFGVTLFFFIVSLFSEYILKISKSSNAFWIMGCLFLPISLLSIGFFKLLGNHYSIFGDGRFMYGMVCCLLCLPIYILSTYKFNSRIFSWLTLSTISLLFAFAVASLYPPRLVLVLILFGFNALLLLTKQKVNSRDILELFFCEMGTFIQFNLFITLVLTMTNFSTDILYSVDLLVLSLIIYSLSITEQRIIYDYLSALIFSTGIFLLGNSINNASIQLILITSIGIVFSTIAFIYKNEADKYSRYSIISAIATGLSFLYIAGYSIPFVHANGIMIYVGIACLIILILNNLHLYLKNNLTIIGVIISPQILILIYEFLYVINKWTDFNYTLEYLSLMTILLFIFGYILNKYDCLKNLAFSSTICSLFSTIIIFICCFIQKGVFISLSIVTAVFTLQILVLWLKNNNARTKLLLGYLLPLVTFGALCLLRYSYSWNFISEYAFYFGCAFIVYCLHFATTGRLKKLKEAFFYCGHILLAIAFLTLLLTNQRIQIEIVSILLMCCVYLYSIYPYRKSKVSYLWLNLLLITFTLLLFKLAYMIQLYSEIDLYKYVFYANGFLLMLAFNFIRKYDFKRNITIYLCLITLILAVGNMFVTNILWYEYCAELVYCALLCLLLTKINLQSILFIPLLLYVCAINVLIQYVLKSNLLCISIVLLGAAILTAVGQRKNKLIVADNSIDFYSITALIPLFLLQYHYYAIDLKSLVKIIPGVLGSIWFLINRKRILENDNRPGNTLFTLSLLWPFYSLVSVLHVHNSIKLEAYLLPLVVLSHICIKWIYRDKNLKLIEYSIPIFCYIWILTNLLVSNSITEAMIIGGFGFFSLIYGSILRTKSTFFSGSILMILTVLIKTSEFWASFQWWAYLAIIGVTLVVIASTNEYQKNKNSEGILQKANKFLERFKDWD